jgi:hypothetical protein
MHVTSQQGSCNYLDKHQSCQVQMIKNLDSFRIVPDHFQKKFFLDKINIGDLSPPPSPKNFRSVYHFRGQKKFSGTMNYQYCPIFWRILHDYLYLNNKSRPFLLFLFQTLQTRADFLSKKQTIFSQIVFLWESVRFSGPPVRPGRQRENLETHG